MANTTPKPPAPSRRRPSKQPQSAPPTGPHRLSADVEKHIRAMVESKGFNSPSIRVLLTEVDCLRLELAEVRTELAEHDRIVKEWSL